MEDVLAHAQSVKRTVEKREHEGRPAFAVVLESVYDAATNDLWDMLTNQDRLPLWFLPVNGELREGGRYQIKGNAGGSITRCDQSERFDLTWEYGEDVSWITVTITAVTQTRTTLRLEHLAVAESDHWHTYGPGAGGVGWDLGMVALAYYIRTARPVDQESFMASTEYKELIPFCSRGWGEAAVNAGYDQEKSLAAAKRTEKFYLGEE